MAKVKTGRTEVHGVTKTCPICKNKFHRPTQEWAFIIKSKTNGHITYYCSWSCLRKAQRKEEII